MITFENIDRNYITARQNFSIDTPDNFNFAFDVLDARAKSADKVALLAVNESSGSKTSVTYSELSTASAKFAQALTKLGLERGDAACVVIGREPAWHKVLFGCMKAGVISMPGTNLLTGKDIAYRVNQSKAKAVIVSPLHVEKVESVRAECPTLEHLIVVGEPSGDWLSFDVLCDAQTGALTADDVPAFKATDTMMIYFTSGTTGMPKMVPRDFGYALAHAATALFWMDLRETDMHWTLTDTGWAKAAWGMLFPQMLIGCTPILYETWRLISTQSES